MSRRNPDLLLQDIIESCNKILNYTVGLTFDEFVNDNKTLDAVIRNFEIIGEAANRLPEEYKDKTSEIDWHKLRGFRNRIVHDYMGIDYSIVWEIRNNYIESLIKNLEKLK